MWDWRQLKWLYYFGWWPHLAKTQGGYKFCRIYGIVLYFSDFIQMLPEVTSILIGMKEGAMGPVILNINQTLMGCQWALKIGAFYVNESKIKRFVAKLAEMDIRGRAILGDEKVDKLSKFRELRCFLTTTYLPVAMSVTLLWIIRPLVSLFEDKKVNVLDAWAAFDTSTTFGWTVQYIFQSVHVLTAIFGLLTFDSFMFCIFEMVHLESDVLKTVLSGLTFKTSENRLRFCIRFHQDIMQLGSEINNFIKKIIFLQSIIFTLVICLSIFEFSSTEGNAMKRFNTLMLSACEVYGSLVYSWLCQELEEENVEVIRAAYDSEWYNASVKDRKSLNMLMMRSQREQKFGLIIHSNLNMFIAVMKSAFSYYQFLDTMII